MRSRVGKSEMSTNGLVDTIIDVGCSGGVGMQPRGKMYTCRRGWSEAENRRIVGESHQHAVSVVARRNGVNA